MNSERKNAIVTGAASGLGRALSVRLARDGWRIALADIDVKGSEETLRQVVAAGGVSSIEEVAALRDAGLDGVILGEALFTGRIDLAEALRVAA
jgi:phosphoribosylformimino-5-aminoimidazole carboxamide ribotide isomerase